MEQIPGQAKLKALIRNISWSRIAQRGKPEDFEIKELLTKPAVYSHWMAIILVSGTKATITFKVHFKTKNAKRLAAPSYGLAPEALARAQAIDYMREFCNLTGGGIKLSLQSLVDLHLSLPIVTRGFDEIFFAEQTRPNSISDHWRLASGESEVICSTTIDFFDPVDLSSLNEEFNSYLENATEVEYL